MQWDEAHTCGMLYAAKLCVEHGTRRRRELPTDRHGQTRMLGGGVRGRCDAFVRVQMAPGGEHFMERWKCRYTVGGMRIYWSSNSVPELTALPKERRQAIFRECVRSAKMPRWVFWGFIPSWIVVLCLLGMIVPIDYPFHLGWTLVAGAWGGVLGLVAQQAKIVSVLPEIRKRAGALTLAD